MLWHRRRRKRRVAFAFVLCLAFGILLPGCSQENNESSWNSSESVSDEENRADTSSDTGSGTEGAYTLDIMDGLFFRRTGPLMKTLPCGMWEIF